TCTETLIFLPKPVSLARIWQRTGSPDQEEHGYFLALVFKCITNPRVVTAYRW
ncbi:hypothetical protein EV401DRAFT_2047787, partial [Pisolithus croceorrhizus]